MSIELREGVTRLEAAFAWRRKIHAWAPRWLAELGIARPDLVLRRASALIKSMREEARAPIRCDLLELMVLLKAKRNWEQREDRGPMPDRDDLEDARLWAAREFDYVRRTS